MTGTLRPRRGRLLAVVSAAAATLFLTSSTAMAEPSPLSVEQQQLFGAIGASLYRSLEVFQLTPEEFELVKKGMVEAHRGKEGVEPAAWNARIQELARARRKAAGDKQAAAGKAFLEQAAGEQGAVKTPSGMVYRSLAEGKGAPPGATDVVKVQYRGTLADGKEFDSSYKRGRPLEFRLDNVIPCWTEGVQLMRPGGKAKLVCPPQLAYGEKGAGERILPGATLAFEVELLEVTQASAATPVQGAASAKAPSAAPGGKGGAHPVAAPASAEQAK